MTTALFLFTTTDPAQSVVVIASGPLGRGRREVGTVLPAATVLDMLDAAGRKTHD